MFAPAQLPLAPRPLPNELLSSWLLRTATANAIPFAELVDGIRRHHPETFLPGQAVDYAVPETTLRALSQWTRVPYAKLRALDLRVRLPQMNAALLLRFPPVPPFGCPQGRSWRVRYAFCPSCVRQQKTFHVRWDWCFAALVRCATHQCLLLDGCPQCGDLEPIRFPLPGTRPSLLCRSCSQNLEPLSPGFRSSRPDDDILGVIEAAYRASLLEGTSDPKHRARETDRALRRFVEDLLELLLVVLPPRAEEARGFGLWSIPRQNLLGMIADFVRNASPTSDRYEYATRYRRSLRLWSALLQVLFERQGRELERNSPRWLASLRRRYVAARERRRQKRWPHAPYSVQPPGLKFKYNTLAAVFNLSARSRGQNAKSRI